MASSKQLEPNFHAVMDKVLMAFLRILSSLHSMLGKSSKKSSLTVSTASSDHKLTLESMISHLLCSGQSSLPLTKQANTAAASKQQALEGGTLRDHALPVSGGQLSAHRPPPLVSPMHCSIHIPSFFLYKA